jgi:hypothetical protein
MKSEAANLWHQASRKKIRTVRFSSLISILPSRASQPNAIDTVDLGALTPFSTALRLDAPLERKKCHTKPAVSPIDLTSVTVKYLPAHQFGILTKAWKYERQKFLFKFSG